MIFICYIWFFLNVLRVIVYMLNENGYMFIELVF